jgi:integrase
MAELRSREGAPARALEFLILTAARSGEVLKAKWDEIDLADAMWTVPGARMKARREHRVPLSPQAVALLRSLPTEANNPYLFVGAQAGGHLNKNTFETLMQRMQRGETTHGFRSAFRTWAAEKTNVPREVCERALAHTVGSATERAYERGDALNKRRKLMEMWGRFATTPATTGTVLPLRGRP